jgi:hypothetical protein
MERGSDLHNPRLDDAIEGETHAMTRGAPIDARAEPEREIEAVAEAQITLRPDLPDGRPGAEMTDAEIRAHSDLARHLRPSVFPAKPLELATCAVEEHAPGQLVDRLRSLPDDRYENLEAVWEALGGHGEAYRS